MKRHVSTGTLTLLLAIGLLAPQPIAAQELSDTVSVPEGDAALGTVSLPRTVMADGQRLSAGDYDVHLTAQAATPDTVGALAVLERWVEFRRGDDVVGREVVSIVPGAEIGDVAKTTAPSSGSSRVELLKENEYMRVWINQSGTHYLIHLLVG